MKQFIIGMVIACLSYSFLIAMPAVQYYNGKVSLLSRKDVQRLDYALYLLDNINKNDNKIILTPYINYQHQFMLECARCVERHQSCRPLHHAWHHLGDQDEFDNADLVREFAVTVILVYHQRLEICPAYKKSPSLQELADLYVQIANLPIQDLLDTIDVLAAQAEVIMEAYDAKHDMTWWQWCKHYWWVPVVCAGSALLTFLKLKKVAEIIA